jgi:hypothetical protein
MGLVIASEIIKDLINYKKWKKEKE